MILTTQQAQAVYTSICALTHVCPDVRFDAYFEAKEATVEVADLKVVIHEVGGAERYAHAGIFAAAYGLSEVPA